MATNPPFRLRRRPGTPSRRRKRGPLARSLASCVLVFTCHAFGCAEDADDGSSGADASDAAPPDATVADALFVGCLEPNADGSCPRDGDPETGLAQSTNADGSACAVRTEVLFCNVNAGSTGGNEAWYDAQADRYVYFGGRPCVTDTERWTYVSDTEHEAWRIILLPQCATEEDNR